MGKSPYFFLIGKEKRVQEVVMIRNYLKNDILQLGMDAEIVLQFKHMRSNNERFKSIYEDIPVFDIPVLPPHILVT
jgi:hypothetical protein